MSDDIGDRFKEYEACWDLALPRRLPLVIRVDGRAFHSLDLVKPFDTAMLAAMAKVAHALCEEVQGARFAYFQSDEVSVVARDDMSLGTQPWLGKRLSKMLSLAAATATSAFNAFLPTTTKPCQFDARAFVVPTLDEVINYVIWRQQDATRNSIQQAARAVFSHKECHLKDQRDLQEMLREAGKPWEEIQPQFKRGMLTEQVVYMRKVVGREDIGAVPRRVWVSTPAPIITEDRERIARVWHGPSRLTEDEVASA